MNKKRSSQNGLSFIELLVAMTVAAMIAGAVVASMFQLFMVSDRNSDHNAAFTQVQNAGYWVSHDAVQAQEVDDTSGLVTLDWVDWDGTNAYKVVYTLEGAGALKELRRSYYINDVVQETIVIAQYIDPGTTCDWDENVLTLEITAQVGDQTVTRTYKVEARPLS